MIKVAVVFGTRPEAIKMVPVIKELKKKKGDLACRVILTAQHRRMLDQVMDAFKVKADYDLDIMKRSQTLDYITGEVIAGIREILRKEKFELVLVHGDTTTTLAASLAAYYEKTKLGHVEAGLRSLDRYNPFPEEMNRRLTDALCDLFFVHTRSARENLIKENMNPERIWVTGNPVIDALMEVSRRKIPYENKQLHKLEKNKKIILVTAHRRENFGKPMENICFALKRIKKTYKDTGIIYPVHKNPSVWDTAHRILKNEKGIMLTEPLCYTDFVNVMKMAYLVLTDSGGLQEEAPSLGKPVLLLRKVTERPEAVKAGTVKIIGTDEDTIVENVKLLMERKTIYRRMANSVNPYGDGKAAERIVGTIKKLQKKGFFSLQA